MERSPFADPDTDCRGGPVRDFVPDTLGWSHDECATIIVGLIAMRDDGLERPCDPPYPCGFSGGEWEPGFAWPVTIAPTRGTNLHLDSQFVGKDLCQYHLSSGFAPSRSEPGTVEAIFCSRPTHPTYATAVAFGAPDKLADADGSLVPSTLCPRGFLCGIGSLLQPEWVEVSLFSTLNSCGGIPFTPSP